MQVIWIHERLDSADMVPRRGWLTQGRARRRSSWRWQRSGLSLSDLVGKAGSCPPMPLCTSANLQPWPRAWLGLLVLEHMWKWSPCGTMWHGLGPVCMPYQPANYSRLALEASCDLHQGATHRWTRLPGHLILVFLYSIHSRGCPSLLAPFLGPR